MEDKKVNKPSSDFNKKNERLCSGGYKPISLPASPSILIILMGSLGDVTRGFCLVSQIKRCFPESTITWLVEPKCEQIVTIHPLIDDVMVFNRSNWVKGGLKDILCRLRKKEFDCVLDLQRHLKSGFFSFVTGAKYRIGFNPKNTKEGNWRFNNIYIPRMDESYPKIFHYLKFTELLGCPLRRQYAEYSPSQSRALLQSGELDFGFSEAGLLSRAADVVSKVRHPFIAMVLGSSWGSKEWLFDGYAGLIRELLDTTDRHIVMVDTPEKYDMACDLEREIKSSRLINLVGQTDLPELAAVLQQAEVAVGPDCGSAHIAAAVGTPYVTLFGPTSHQRTAPFGCEHLIVDKGLDCAPCYKRKCPGKGLACMHAIKAEDVKEKILQVLNG